MTVRREPVSIVCVFNNSDVRAECLDRSIEAYGHEAVGVEYLPIDNTDQQFTTAGAALNYGASRASNDYLVFVHQDVYLHSLRALEEAAGVLANNSQLGLLGAIGIARDGVLHGRIRDRIVLIGNPAAEPTPVDSLDEVLFVIPKSLIAQEPIADDPDLAWHAYAVEYGLRLKSSGLDVGAIDIPLTHNSLTINLDRLDVAHGVVGDRYPQLLPVRTTCGTIARPRRPVPGEALLRPHRWRYRWLQESVATHRVRREAGGLPFALCDIRLHIDDVVARLSKEPLRIVNVADRSPFADESSEPLALTRIDRIVLFSTTGHRQLAGILREHPLDAPMLLTNLEHDDLSTLRATRPADRLRLGFHSAYGLWALVGSAAQVPIPAWQAPRAVPLGMSAPTG